MSGNRPLFPSYDYPPSNWKDPFQLLAERLEVSEERVDAAFRGLGIPEWEDSRHLDVVNSNAALINRAATHARQLVERLSALPNEELDHLVFIGAPTIPQLEHLRDALSGDARQLKDWVKERDRTGGRNPAAHSVAEAVRRIFRRERREIKVGHDAGIPNTEFGLAVEAAIGVFGIVSNWRPPAEAAFKRQKSYEHRLLEIHLGRTQKSKK